jgi:hypothetical protein
MWLQVRSTEANDRKAVSCCAGVKYGYRTRVDHKEVTGLTGHDGHGAGIRERPSTTEISSAAFEHREHEPCCTSDQRPSRWIAVLPMFIETISIDRLNPAHDDSADGMKYPSKSFEGVGK